VTAHPAPRPPAPEFRMGLNYGVNKVRFPAPVPVGSRIRGHFEVLSIEDVEGGIQVVTKGTIEREGQEKPVCVAEMVSRHYR
jgi:acyl dehydratase